MMKVATKRTCAVLRVDKRLIASLILMTLAGHSTASTLEVEHDRAKQLVHSGKILALDVTLAKLWDQCPGKLIDAKLYYDRGMWRYDLHIKSVKGPVLALSVDAASGEPAANAQLPLACRARD